MYENNKINVFKIVVFNLLGFMVGTFAYYVSYLLLKYLFVDLLGQLGFIVNLLSWPVDYQWYAVTGIVIGSVVVSFFVCAKISALSKCSKNWSVIFLALLLTIDIIFTAIIFFGKSGFDFTTLIIYIISVITYVVGVSTTFENEK